jgi:hypothetical protein
MYVCWISGLQQNLFDEFKFNGMLCYQLEEFLYDCVLLLILGVPVNQIEYESEPKKFIDNEISVGQRLSFYTEAVSGFLHVAIKVSVNG